MSVCMVQLARASALPAALIGEMGGYNGCRLVDWSGLVWVFWGLGLGKCFWWVCYVCLLLGECWCSRYWLVFGCILISLLLCVVWIKG